MSGDGPGGTIWFEERLFLIQNEPNYRGSRSFVVTTSEEKDVTVRMGVTGSRVVEVTLFTMNRRLLIVCPALQTDEVSVLTINLLFQKFLVRNFTVEVFVDEGLY